MQAESTPAQKQRQHRRRASRARNRTSDFANQEPLIEWQLYCPELATGTHTGVARPLITDSEMERLLTLANIPNDPCAQRQLRQSVRLAIDCHAEEALKAPEVVPSLKRIALAARDLREALSVCPRRQ